MGALIPLGRAAGVTCTISGGGSMAARSVRPFGTAALLASVNFGGATILRTLEGFVLGTVGKSNVVRRYDPFDPQVSQWKSDYLMVVT